MTHTLDLNFLDLADTIAAFLVETAEGPALIETGPYSTFGHLRSAVKAHGYDLEDIRHVFITHIHLDHAGSAWALAEHGATIHLHPFGLAHLQDPSKLLASATRIYGDEMDRLWGTLKPIPGEQLQPAEHGEAITVGGLEFRAWHTPGHAVHHIAWQVGSDLFSGDAAGVKIEGGPAMPPCPPPDIDIEAWMETLALIRRLVPARLFLTHFGPLPAEQIESHLDELQAGLLDWSAWMRPHYEAGAKAEEITPLFQAYVQAQLREKGVGDDQLERYENANPSWMSVAGLLRYWRKRLG
jgi:glyoxylase-like metal-dependent hydrolase (beta-lactamase superfamily II)